MLGWLLLLAAIDPVPSDVAVLGVVIQQAAGRSTAVLRSGGRSRVVAVGETAFGGEVVSVSARGVVLQFASGRVEVPLTIASQPPPSASPATPRPPLAREAAEPAEDPATPHRLMARAEVERRLGAEIPRILAETALAPLIEDGHVTGLTVTRVPEGTVLSDAGLRSGDVIKQINDTVIDGMGTLIGLWPRLQGATELRAVVQRGGRPVVLSVTLR